MNIKHFLNKISLGMEILVKLYIVLTIFLFCLFMYQKFIVDFDDIVKYTPLAFLENEYVDTKTINFYSFIGTTNENTPLNTRDVLFCRNENEQWERIIFPPAHEVSLKIDDLRNAKIDELNNSIDTLVVDNAETIKKVREFGEELAQNDGFSIKYNIASIKPPFDKTCRLRVYYETKTNFFDLTKSKNFFSHTIRIRKTEK